jgi:hypothetical protein
MSAFDLAWPDERERADWYEDCIRAFFSHPKMTGVFVYDYNNATHPYPNFGLIGNDLKVRNGFLIVNVLQHTI